MCVKLYILLLFINSLPNSSCAVNSYKLLKGIICQLFYIILDDKQKSEDFLFFSAE